MISQSAHAGQCANPVNNTNIVTCQTSHINYELLIPEAMRSFLLMQFKRGDCNGDGAVDISDPIFLANTLINNQQNQLDCQDACDPNDNGALTLDDANYLLNWLFVGGPAPRPPHGACGLEPTFDALNCRSYSACP
jgi:hypothetical protein